MPLFIAVFTSILLITFLDSPTMGAGWIWDVDNALGFAAFAGMLYLTIPVNARRGVRNHERVGYAVLVVALVHAYWFLLADGASVEFVKPGAPGYMWLGIAGLVLLFLSVTLALLPTRQRVHKNYPTFRHWHRAIAILAIASATYHIVVSNFYLVTWYQGAAFVALAALVAFGRAMRIDGRRFSGATPLAYLAASATGAVVFAAIRNFAP